MFANPSLTTRVSIGKGIGFIVGLLGFVFLPYFIAEPSWMLRWGILFWYVTFGAIVGVFGIYTEHPVLRLPMPWWFRAPFIGAWLNFVLTLFAYETLEKILIEVFGTGGIMSSPFWFVLEGAIVGLIIGYFATRFGGEGKETALE